MEQCDCKKRIELLEAEVGRLTVENGCLHTWKDDQEKKNKRLRHHYICQMQRAVMVLSNEERTSEDEQLYVDTKKFLSKNWTFEM